MQTAEVLIPILVPLGAFAMVFGIVYLKSRENMAMIERGLNPKEFANRPAPYRNLKNGLLFLGAGIGLALAYLLTNYVLHDEESRVLWFALIAIGGGLGLIRSYQIEKKELLDKEGGKVKRQTSDVRREEGERKMEEWKMEEGETPVLYAKFIDADPLKNKY